MTLQETIKLLKAGAEACRSWASEGWTEVSGLHFDAASLDELSAALEGGVHLWVEGPDGLCTRITTDNEGE